MRIRLIKSYHATHLRSLIEQAWRQEELLIFCPPHLQNLDFVKFLPEGEIETLGAWDNHDSKTLFINIKPLYPVPPVLGVFTSGTVSGHPRLVLYTKENIEASLAAIMSLFETARVQTIFSYAQPFHTFGLLLGYVLSLKLGCELVTPEGKYGSHSHRSRLAVVGSNVLTLGTPAHFHDLIEVVRREGTDLARTYSCIMGGASVSKGLWNQVRDVLRIEAPSVGYGCTEAAPGVTHLPPGVAPKENSEIGFPLSNLQSRVEKSQIVISGPSLCLAVIDENGVDFSLRRSIRDQIRVRGDGAWVFEGRSDLMLNRGGEKISLERIENSVHSELGFTVVGVAVCDPRLGEDLGLLCKRPSSCSEKECFEKIKEFVLTQFRVRMLETNVRFTNSFPLSSSSKPDRKLISQEFWDELK